MLVTFGSISYADNQMACGGYPSGYWTNPNNATVNRCSIFVTVHEDWISYVNFVILLTCIVIFWISAWKRVTLTENL
jgi:hypothetical protein